MRSQQEDVIDNCGSVSWGENRLSPAALAYSLVALPLLGEAHLSLGHVS